MELAILLVVLFYLAASLLLLVTFAWVLSFTTRKVSLREFFLFMTYIALLAFCIGYLNRGHKVTSGKLNWELSKARDISCLSGGKWHGQSKDRYSINGDRDLHLSVILDGDRRFEFDSVNRISADRSGSKITKISISSFGYSKEKAVERLKTMHLQWNDQNIESIEMLDRWIKKTAEKKNRPSYSSMIHLSECPNDPAIGAYLHSLNSIIVTFTWHDPKYKTWPDQVQVVEVEPIARKLTWDLSKSRDLSQISGCKLYPFDGTTSHYLEGDRGLSVSLILKGGRRFDFDSVREVYVDQPKDRITRIKIIDFGHSQQGAIDRLKRMHRKGTGEGIDKVNEWVLGIEEGRLGGHSTIIHRATNTKGIGIEATIVGNHGGGRKKPWAIETTFFWEGFTYESPFYRNGLSYSRGDLPISRRPELELEEKK